MYKICKLQYSLHLRPTDRPTSYMFVFWWFPFFALQLLGPGQQPRNRPFVAVKRLHKPANSAMSRKFYNLLPQLIFSDHNPVFSFSSRLLVRLHPPQNGMTWPHLLPLKLWEPQNPHHEPKRKGDSQTKRHNGFGFDLHVVIIIPVDRLPLFLFAIIRRSTLMVFWPLADLQLEAFFVVSASGRMPPSVVLSYISLHSFSFPFVEHDARIRRRFQVVYSPPCEMQVEIGDRSMAHW